MTMPKPMPPDFPEHATLSLRALADRYGVGKNQALMWRRSLGIYIPKGAPKGNGNALRNAGRAKQTHGIDGIEAVRTCLSCTRGRCSGSCEKVH